MTRSYFMLLLLLAGSAWGQYTPTAPTPSDGDNSTRIGTTAFHKFQNLIGGTNTSAAMVVNAGGTLVPNSGEIAGNNLWLFGGPTAPSTVVTATQTGGSLTFSQFYSFVFTYSNALGETLAGPQFSVQMGTTSGSTNCTSGTACTVTLAAPTLPLGYTSYTVYDVQANVPTSGWLKQAAANNCVNITGNCTIATKGAGAGIPTSPSNIILPLNFQATTVPCPDNLQPLAFLQADDGNFYAAAGIDNNTTGNFASLPSPHGVFTWCRNLFVSDTTSPQGITNALVSINHTPGLVTKTSSTTDDRAFAIRTNLANTPTPTFEQFLGQYVEHFVDNTAFQCNPAGGETCTAAVRARTDLKANTTSIFTGAVGVYGAASTDVTPMNVGSCVFCIVGVQGFASQNTASNQVTSAGYVGGEFGVNASSGNSGSAQGYGVVINAPGVRFTGKNFGLNIADHGTNAADWDIYVQGGASGANPVSGQNYLGGRVFVPALLASSGTLNITGSLNATGGITSTQIATPVFSNGNVANIGASGATAYTYQVVLRDAAGGTTIHSANGSTSTGNATLDSTNKNRLTINVSPGYSTGSATVDIYRTASSGTPSSTGKIGTHTCSDIVLGGNGTACTNTFDDTGLAGDSTTPPAVNTTGGINLAGPTTVNTLATATNCANGSSPASCSSAAAGAVAVPTGTNPTLQINTTSVTANSQIFLSIDESLTIPSTTCNTTLSTLVQPVVTARSAGASFTIQIGAILAGNPACVSYFIVN